MRRLSTLLINSFIATARNILLLINYAYFAAAGEPKTMKRIATIIISQKKNAPINCTNNWNCLIFKAGMQHQNKRFLSGHQQSMQNSDYIFALDKRIQSLKINLPPYLNYNLRSLPRIYISPVKIHRLLLRSPNLWNRFSIHQIRILA